MSFITQKNKCRELRFRLSDMVGGYLNADADWIQQHIKHCCRCRARLAGFNRVEIALSLLKTEPHKVDLLGRANNQAIRILKHSLRDAPRAQSLKHKQPEPKWYQRCARYTHSIGNAAACLAILLLMRMGIFSSMNKFQDEGQKVLKQYYKHQLPDDSSLVDDLFRA